MNSQSQEPLMMGPHSVPSLVKTFSGGEPACGAPFEATFRNFHLGCLNLGVAKDGIKMFFLDIYSSI